MVDEEGDLVAGFAVEVAQGGLQVHVVAAHAQNQLALAVEGRDPVALARAEVRVFCVAWITCRMAS